MHAGGQGFESPRLRPLKNHAGFSPLNPLQKPPQKKAAKTLPTVSQDDTVRRLLAACPDKFEGRRNRALVALVAGDLLCLMPNLVDVVAVEEAHGSPGLVVEGGC